MSRQIPEEIIQEIRERTDIVEVVSSYLPLKRSGANNQGLCPFHSEKSPSFNVNSTRQIFHCFGCGVGGNVFTFLMRMEGLAFPEAVRRLGEKVGVEVPDEQMTPAEEQRRQERERLARVNEVAADYYHQLLLDSDDAAPARRYLRQRGFDAEAVRTFRLGYAPDQWEGLARHLKAKGFEANMVRDQLGLTRSGKDGREDYDLFRKRLMIPIVDVRDQVVAFGGRVLDDSLPKYINSPESPIYHKSRVLYGLNGAREAMRREDAGIIVEGYFDQMALHRAGFANSVATCGTALTEEHARLLKRYTGRLLLLFDQDKAGKQATLRAMDVLLPAGLSVAVVSLQEGSDPDSFLAEHGSEAMRERLDSARPVLEYYIDLTLEECGETVEGRARAVEAIAGKLRLLTSDIERDLYIKSVAGRTGLEADLLRDRIAAVKPPARRSEPAPPPRRPPAEPPEPYSAPPEPYELPPQPYEAAAPAQRPAPAPAAVKVPEAVVKAQESMLRLLLEQRVAVAQVEPDALDELFPGEAFREIAENLVAHCAQADSVDGGRLHERLSPDAAELLARIENVEAEDLSEDPDDIFAGCRLATKKYALTVQSRKLQTRIAQALEDGDTDLYATLQKDYLDLKKNEKKL